MGGCRANNGKINIINRPASVKSDARERLRCHFVDFVGASPDICRFLVIIEFSRALTRRSRFAWKMTSMIDREDNGVLYIAISSVKCLGLKGTTK